MLVGKRILLIVTGGIAAYKSLELIRRLRERGAQGETGGGKCREFQARTSHGDSSEYGRGGAGAMSPLRIGARAQRVGALRDGNFAVAIPSRDAQKSGFHSRVRITPRPRLYSRVASLPWVNRTSGSSRLRRRNLKVHSSSQNFRA